MTWSCPACTYVNDKSMTKCEVCDAKRPVIALKNICLVPCGFCTSQMHSEYNKCTICGEKLRGSTNPDPVVMTPPEYMAELRDLITKNPHIPKLELVKEFTARGVRKKIPIIPKMVFISCVPFQYEGHFETQKQALCGKHTINNLFGSEIFVHNDTTDKDISKLFMRPDLKGRNIAVVNNYINSTGVITVADSKDKAQSQNFAHNLLHICFGMLGYKLWQSNSWRKEGDYFYDNDGKKFDRFNVLGWMVNERGGHWYGIRLDKDGNMWNVNSSLSAPVKFTEKLPRCDIVYYDYIYDLEWFDVCSEYTKKNSSSLIEYMVKEGFSHHPRPKIQMKP